MPLLQAVPSHRGPLGVEPEQLKQLLVAKPFKFIVGRDRMGFYIHPGFVSRLSVPLNALVDSGAEERLEGCVTWEDVDDDVFLRFAEFAYTGAYTGFAPAEKDAPTRSEGATEISANVAVVKPENIPAKKVNVSYVPGFGLLDEFVPTDPFQEDDENYTFKLPYSLASYMVATARTHALLCSVNSRKRKFSAIECDCNLRDKARLSKRRHFISLFMDKQPGFARNSTADICQAQSFGHVFIGHARIWVFADRYAIVSLMDLACAKLIHELVHWTISAPAFVPDFGGLVRYVYGDHTAGGSQLRLLVGQFAACVVEDVSDLEGWSVLLHEVPDFAADLVNQMTNRLG